MCDAVIADSADSRIATDDFTKACGGGITIICGFYIGSQNAAEFGQFTDETSCQQRGCFSARFIVIGSIFTVFLSEAKSCQNLFGQQTEQGFYIYTDMVVDGMAVNGGITKVAGEDNGACLFYYLV